MGNIVVKSPIRHHNQVQLDYFAGEDKATMVPVNSYYVRRHIERFLEHSGLSRDEKILEVGCGMGKFTFPLLERGYKLIGLDLNPYLLQKLLTYNDNRFQIDLIASDILDTPEEYNEQFDHLIGFFTLHHFINLEVYLKAMARLLKPEGKISFLEPNAWNPLYYVQIFMTPRMSWAGDKGVALMREKKFREGGEYAGLRNLKLDKYGFFPPFAANTKIGKETELLLEKAKVLNPFSAFQVIQYQK